MRLKVYESILTLVSALIFGFVIGISCGMPIGAIMNNIPAGYSRNVYGDIVRCQDE